jgi:hypothetical protein
VTSRLRFSTVRFFLTALSALLILPAAGCAHALRERVTPFPENALHASPWRLNRELLQRGTSSRILFVVDVEGGTPPSQDPLDHLAEIASKYGQRPAKWVVLGDPEAPQVETDRAGSLRCPSGPLDPATSYVFIRYVGDVGEGMYGRTLALRVAPECGDKKIFAIQIAQDTLASHRFLWLTPNRLEENDLVHEYGHVLGLGSNPIHGFYPDYPDLSAGDHCVNPQCALASPRPRAGVYRFFKTGFTFRVNGDFCSQCRRDIEDARRYWRTGERTAESRRLPQPDLAKWIAKLEDEDFQEGGKAMILLAHGKEVMPALMKRMLTLPGNHEESPRAHADKIAKAIVSREAIKRAGIGYSGDWDMTDQSREMLWWWMKEGKRFMNGNQWELPSVVAVVPRSGPTSRIEFSTAAPSGAAGSRPAAPPLRTAPVPR